jgi:putative nucleotidyltransferase with HDIG domain
MSVFTAALEKIQQPAPNVGAPIPVSEVLSALSFALDLTEGQPMGHSVRSCVLGMRLAHEIGLPPEARSDLYYASLMKDAGCSTNAARLFQIIGTDEIKAKRDVKTTDWTRLGWESLEYALTHVRTGSPFLVRVRALFDVAINQKELDRELVQLRCERGAAIARRMGLSEAAASAIHSLDEHWNGKGNPDGLRGQDIPLLARIMNLAQTLDVFYTAQGPTAAIGTVLARSGRWFDPELVRAAVSLAQRDALWAGIEDATRLVIGLEPREETLAASEATLDNICLAFADVIDAKTPFTYQHSTGVASSAIGMARTLAMSETEVTLIRRAALLHDIGKLSVPNTILEKPDKLDNKEWDVVRKHPYYSFEILRRIPAFGELSEVAASHHEKLDGSGYFRSLTAEQMSLPVRILVVADIYDALSAKRPYRDALPTEKVFEIMQKEAVRQIDAVCLEALMTHHASPRSTSQDLARLSAGIGQSGVQITSEEKNESLERNHAIVPAR